MFNKLCGRPPQYAPPLQVASGQAACHRDGRPPSDNIGLWRPNVRERQTRQTDKCQTHIIVYMPPTLWA